MEQTTKKMFSGAAILGVATLLAKLLGALYRIPLTNLIGSKGLGLYQTVFPVYALLLEFSGAGVPNAMAKIIASYRGYDRELYAKKILKTSLLFFAGLGCVFSVLIAIFSRTLATAQGNEGATLAYLYLSPSVLLVCLICCFRGYFQGFANMMQTAISQIVEQTVKLFAGLYFARLFLPNVERSVAGATLAITLSEAVALIGIIIAYVVKVKRQRLPAVKLCRREFFVSFKEIIVFALPIAFIGVILPVSKVIDSFIIVNFLSEFSTDATGIYGVFSGVVTTVIGLPVAVCYGISAVSVPIVSAEGEKDKRGFAVKAILLTLALSLPSAFLCFALAPFIVNFLFGNLSLAHKTLSVNLLKTCSPSVVLLSLLQTLNGILIGKGELKKPMISMAAGVSLKTVIELFTLKLPEIGIYGAAIGSIACYFVANLINLSMVFPIKFKRNKNESLSAHGRRYADS